MKGIDAALMVQLGLSEATGQKNIDPSVKVTQTATEESQVLLAKARERGDIFERLYKDLLMERIAK